MIPIPGDSNKYTQPNNSDLFGVLSATKNIDLDSEGYIALASRTALLAAKRGGAFANLGMVTSFGRYGLGELLAMTTDAPFDINLDTSALSVAEDTGTGNPAGTNSNRGTWFNSRWYATGGTSLSWRTAASDTWTSAGITLTVGKVHAVAAFLSKVALAVSNGDKVKLLDTSHAELYELVIPAEFEIIGMAYNNQQLGIITRLGDGSVGAGSEAHFFVWNGDSNGADGGAGIGSDAAFGVVPYKGSWAVLTRAGQLLFWNGGGFDVLASFPSYFARVEQGDFLNIIAKGDIMRVEGDVIYINLPSDFTQYGPKQESNLPTQPAGVWVYDPEVGLYHKYSASNSQLTIVSVLEAGVNFSTNVITADSGTIASTGSPVKMVDGGIGGLKVNKVYYTIKESSTTFKLAETRAAALAGAAVDLTSVAETSKFLFLDVVDYGVTDVSDCGAIELMGTMSMVYNHVIFAARFLNPTLQGDGADFCICVSVPDFKNIGYFVTSRIKAENVKDTWQRLFSHIRPLREGERIIVKTKTQEFFGLPVSVPQFNTSTMNGTWTGNHELYSTGDFAEALEQFDAGTELEMEILSGAGAGQMSKITNIAYDGTSYAFELEDMIEGASGGRPATFRVDNFELAGIIDSSTVDVPEGILKMALKPVSPWIQLKVIFEGCDMRMGGSELDNIPHED